MSKVLLGLVLTGILLSKSGSLYAKEETKKQQQGKPAGNDQLKTAIPSEVWISIPPVGPNISDLVVAPKSPDVMYAAVGREVFKTIDGGRVWKSASKGLDLKWVYSLTVDQTAPDTLYATGEGGIYKSSDGARTWSGIGGGILEERRVWKLQISSADPRHLYAFGQKVARIAFLVEAIYKSMNGGRTWAEIGPEEVEDITSVAVNPEMPDQLFATSHTKGLYRSNDGGQTWIQIIDEKCKGNDWSSVNFHPTDGSSVFAICDNLLASLDSGKTWNIIPISKDNVSIPESYKDNAYTFPDNGSVYSSGSVLFIITKSTHLNFIPGILKSPDSGKTWQYMPGYFTRFQIISDTTYVAGTETGGVWKTVNGGQTWHVANVGLPINMSLDLASAAISSDNGYILAGVWRNAGFKSEVYRTHDGLSWEYYASDFYYEKNMFGRGRGNIITIDTGIEFLLRPAGLALKNLLASDWRKYKTPVDNPIFLAASPLDSQTLYLLGYQGNFGFGSVKTVLSFSDDGGFSWSTNEIPLLEICSVAAGKRSLFIGGAIGAGSRLTGLELWKTDDAGKSWSSIAQGIKSLTSQMWKHNPRMISSDALTAIAIHPSSENVIFVGTRTSGAFKTVDGGKKWTSVSGVFIASKVDVQRLPTDWNTSVNSITFHPQDPKTIFIASNAGVFRSSDGGNKWQSLNSGLNQLQVKTIQIQKGPPFVVIANDEHNLYRLSDSGASWSIDQWNALWKSETTP